MKNILLIIYTLYFSICYIAVADEKLNKIQNEVLLLKSSINQSEKHIHKKNQEYKQIINELKVYEDKLQVISYTLSEYKQKIKIDYIDLQKNWNVLLMQQADDARHEEYLVMHQAIIETMKQKSENLKRNIAWATNLEKDLLETQLQASQLKMKSDVLLGLIQDLENDKLSLISKVNEQKTLGQKEENRVINNTLESKLSRGDFFVDKNFSLPIRKFVKIEKSETGINFHYRDATYLMAPSNGKIIYVGELSNYGNVVMIEHDKKMISVLLGDIRPEVEELSIVTQGSVIGKLIADKDGGLKSLYYEIRKEEKPMPTLSYLKVN